MIPFLGAHVSVAGGYENGILKAEEMGAEAIQIFGASPRIWMAKWPSKAAIEVFQKTLARNRSGALGRRVSKIFLHASYFVNLASPEAASYKMSIASLCSHLEIAELLGADGLIFHMGSTKNTERAAGVARTIRGIGEVLKKVPGKTKLIMENSAGGGDKLGAELSEIGEILKSSKSPRVGVCIDTAHAFESGMIAEFTPAVLSKFCDDFQKKIGLKNLVAMHANDSKTPALSHHDRHENIGEGFIGLSGFKALAKEKRLHGAAWMLEVPGFDGLGPDKKNLDILKSCFGK